MKAEGGSASELARIFGVDHTSILYQCKKHGMKPFEKKEIVYKSKRQRAEGRRRAPILEREGINLGKDSYGDYLKEDKKREFTRDKKGNIIRIKSGDNSFD